MMAVDFKTSQTKDNLMRAFAGESQARNRYTFAAEKAKKDKQQMIEKVFKFTADQEKAHAEVFYNHLKELSGETVFIDGGYPVDIYENVLDLVKKAKHNEYEEYGDVYPAFAEVAKQEGFNKVAQDFLMIAAIEKIHGDRFEKLATLLENNELYVSASTERWMCLNCGHIYEGTNVPPKCPVCTHDQGYFVRIDMAPYTDPEML